MNQYKITITTEYAHQVGAIALLAEAIMNGYLSVGFEDAFESLLEAMELAAPPMEKKRRGEIVKLMRKWTDELEAESTP